MQTTTTCQICGRGIQAKCGLIAHHGYKRPSQGWQTASCSGARHVPYEQGKDALEAYIPRLTKWREDKIAAVGKMMAEPPETLTEAPRYRGHAVHTYTRPAGFDAEVAARCVAMGAHSSRTYACEFAHAVSRLKRHIEEMRLDLEYLGDRLAKWKAPTP